MAINQAARILHGAALLIFGTAVAAFNAVNLDEAYGSGPPYYSRTTNMDKWSSPLPVLFVVDVIAVLAMAAYVFMLLKRSSNSHE